MTARALARVRTIEALMHGPALQRKCACAEHGASCARCEGTRGHMQREAQGSRGPLTHVPSIVNDVLSSSGAPLDGATRRLMEQRFERDFSAVRVHTDERAQRSAAAVDANAYTVGTHVVFAAGRYAPGRDGLSLLGHELAHVVQQSSGLAGAASEVAAESEAEQAGVAVAAGRRAAAMLLVNRGLQRDAASVSALAFRSIAGEVTKFIPGNSGSTRLVRAALAGVIEELIDQVRRKGLLSRLWNNLKNFHAADAPRLAFGYGVGVAEGLISPVTDLFGILTFGEQMRNLATRMAAGVFKQAYALAAELTSLAGIFDELAEPLRKFWRSLKAPSGSALQKLLSIPDAISEGAESMAYDIGRKGGASIAASIESPWAKDEKPKEPAPGWLDAPLSRISHEFAAGEEKLLDDPWSKLGNKAGYAVGFVTVQALLLAFSGSIGNMITEAAAGLGRFGQWLGSIGKGVIGMAERLASAGKVIAEAEAAIDALVARLLKPLGPVLEPLLKPLGGVLEKLKGFIRRVLGLAEKEAAPLASAAATKGAAELAEHIPTGPAKPPVVPHAQPHAPPPVHQSTPHAGQAQAAEDLGKTAPSLTSRPAPHEPAPHVHDRPEDGMAKAAPVADADKVLAERPAEGGHHIRVKERGIELCSPEPCPLLDVEYAEEMTKFPAFKDRFNRIQAMRKAKPDEAATAASVLQRDLESLRSNPPRFTKVPPQAAPEGPTAVPKEGPKPPAEYSDILDEPGFQEAPTPGGRQPRQGMVAGSVTHQYYEDLPEMLARRAEDFLPEGALAAGLEKEYRIPHPDYPPGRKPRIDRLNRETGEVIEIGPDSRRDEKFAEAQQYAEWMNRFEHRSDGKRWWPSVRTYNRKTVRQFLRDIGYFEGRMP